MSDSSRFFSENPADFARFVRSSNAPLVHPSTIDAQLRLWILRILVKLGGSRGFIRSTCFSDDDLANALGLIDYTSEKRPFNPQEILAELRCMLATTEAELEPQQTESKPDLPESIHALDANIHRFSALIGLNDDDTTLLRFALLIHAESTLDDAADRLGRLSHEKTVETLAVILDLPHARVDSALSNEGMLARAGLLSIDSNQSTLRGKLNVMSSKFVRRMTGSRGEPLDMLKGMVNACQTTELIRSDFDHLGDHLALISDYLRKATTARRPGVNVLFHGPPGTGKTELTRMLAGELKLPLYEVSSEDNEGDPASGNKRISAFCMAQTIFSRQPGLIVFDEVEDIFGSARRERQRRGDSELSKAWVNRLLEHNPVPTFWITNEVGQLDPAYVRRFDFVLRVGQPPREAREQLLVRRCGEVLPESTLRRLAAHPHLSPGLITRSASVLESIRAQLPPERYETSIVQMLDQSLRAQGHAPISELADNPLPPFYDPRFINTDENLDAILAGIRRNGSARLCLYGPPGTGKTAFGRYIAEQLKCRLQVTRVSDILGPYVGMTESNLADAFAQAKASKAVLLIDEVDSFLQDRSRAGKSWEVTAVNEMLTQMESFPGVFIASTNLMAGLDPAALRRFDLKLRFDPLRPEQAWELLCLHARQTGLDEPGETFRSQMEKLSTLTPGDFAAVERRNRFYPLVTTEELVRALAHECAQKAPAGPSGPIGFGLPPTTLTSPSFFSAKR
jgi:transitional endoplasmic reticulum ATPase